MDVRLLAELASAQRKVWCHVFLDSLKAHDALDCTWPLELLRKCGVGPNILQTLERFWANHTAHPRQGGCYDEPTMVKRGVTQGDAVSPILFNVVIDAMMRHWRCQLDPSNTGDPLTMSVNFYANDSHVGGTDLTAIQQSLDSLANLFARTGLGVNAGETKAMVGRPSQSFHSWDSLLHRGRLMGEGLSPASRKHRKVVCPKCQLEMRAGSLACHRATVHGDCSPAPPKRARRTLAFDKVCVSPRPEPGTQIQCPVPGCPGQTNWTCDLRKHF